MPRKPRLFSPDFPYHIISRGNNRQTLFRKPEDFSRYLFFLKFLNEEFPFDLYHYCLMSNHVHLLMRFPSEKSFREVTKRIHLLYAKYFSREYRHVGHVFQDRFKSYPVENWGYMLECGRYIERNPINAKMCEKVGDYQWSSARHYLGLEINKIVTLNPSYFDLADTDPERRIKYRDYLESVRPYEQEVERTLFGRQLIR